MTSRPKAPARNIEDLRDVEYDDRPVSGTRLPRKQIRYIVVGDVLAWGGPKTVTAVEETVPPNTVPKDYSQAADAATGHGWGIYRLTLDSGEVLTYAGFNYLYLSNLGAKNYRPIN